MTVLNKTPVRAWILVSSLLWSFSSAACSDDDATAAVKDAGSAHDEQHDHDNKDNQDDKKDASTGQAQSASSTEVDLKAFEATGLNMYLGKAKPAETQTEGDEVHYLFNEEDGPVCLRGGRFGMATRDKSSDDLVIYLQGGGSCTTALCRATETADPKIPGYGILNAADADNPVADWNVVYSPYCDGSLHFGDSDIPDQNRKHHGLRNVSATLDVAHEQFASPKRVLLTGASAGGYGTIWVTALVRLIYPDAKLFVFNDAGIAISNPDSTDGFHSVLKEWGADKFIPDSCEDCKTSPHLTPWMSWNLQHDPTLTLGMFSSYEDSVISGTFLMIDAQVFKQALLEETSKVVDTAPERAKRFLVNGMQHTVGDIHATAVDDLTVAQWLQRMLDQDKAWDNVLQ